MPDDTLLVDITVNNYDDFDRLDDTTQRGLVIDYEYDANGSRIFLHPNDFLVTVNSGRGDPPIFNATSELLTYFIGHVPMRIRWNKKAGCGQPCQLLARKKLDIMSPNIILED